jgi:hypothetical protein
MWTSVSPWEEVAARKEVERQLAAVSNGSGAPHGSSSGNSAAAEAAAEAAAAEAVAAGAYTRSPFSST